MASDRWQAEQDRRIHVFLVGDSTVCDYPADVYPRAGWGQVLGRCSTGG